MSPRTFYSSIQRVLAETKGESYTSRDQALMSFLYDFLHERGFAPFGLDLFFQNFKRGDYENCIYKLSEGREATADADGQREVADPESFDN